MKFYLKNPFRIDIWKESPEGPQTVQRTISACETRQVSRSVGDGYAQLTKDSQNHHEVVVQ